MITIVDFGVKISDDPLNKEGKFYTPLITLSMQEKEDSDDVLTFNFIADRSTRDLKSAKEIMGIIKDAITMPDEYGEVTEEGNVTEGL